MVCPFCLDQTLVVIPTISGQLEMCPSCQGLFIPWDMLAHFSGDAEGFLATLQQIQGQLFPTGRICPQCLGRLSQGRWPDHDGIVTLCSTCRRFWSDPSDLELWNSKIAWALQTQIQAPAVPVDVPPLVAPEAAAPEPPPVTDEAEIWNESPETQQTQLQEKYQALEKSLQDTWKKREQDQLQRPDSDFQKMKEALSSGFEQKLESLQKSVSDLEQKRLEQETFLNNLKNRLEAAEAERAVLMEAHLKQEQEWAQRYSEGIKQTEGTLEKNLQEKLAGERMQYAEHLASLQNQIQGLETQLEDASKKPVKSSLPAPVYTGPVSAEPPPTIAPETKRPLPEPVKHVTPVIPVTPPKPVVPKPQKPSVWDQMKALWTPSVKKPLPAKPAAKPPVAAPPPAEVKPETKTPVLEPVKPVSSAPAPIAKPTPQKLPKISFWTQMKALWAPAAQKASDPKPLPTPPAVVVPAKISPETPKIETDLPKLPISKPVPKEKTPSKGLWASFKEAWTPAPKKPASIKPAPTPVPSPVVKPDFEKAPPAVAVPVPTPEEKPISKPAAPAPKPRPVASGPKTPILWTKQIALWSPRVLPLITYVISYSLDEDAGWAFLWATVIGGAGLLVRLKWLYPPSKVFSPSLISNLAALALPKKGRAIPVSLTGTLVDPKAKLLQFQDSSGTVGLNALGPLEILPRLFGLISPGQYPAGELILDGWYRPGKIPFVEVHQIRQEKITRKSLVRALRWSWALFLLIFGSLLLLMAS